METDFSLELDDEMDGPPTMPGLGTKSRKHLKFLRPRVLYTIANDVLNIADRMPTASERESWAKWADEVFMQMELEEQTSEDWSHPIAAGRGRCWLIIGSTRFEAIEARIESGEQALDSDDVERARDALLRGMVQTNYVPSFAETAYNSGRTARKGTNDTVDWPTYAAGSVYRRRLSNAWRSFRYISNINTRRAYEGAVFRSSGGARDRCRRSR